MMGDGNGADVLSIKQSDGCDERLAERFPCILRPPRSASDLRAYVAREWIACADWLTACTCDPDQSEMIAMIRAAGEQMRTQMPQVSSLAPITTREARRDVYGETDQALMYGMLLHLAAAAPDLAEIIRPLASQLLLAYATLIYHDEGDRIDLCLATESAKHPVPSAVSASRLVRQLASGKHAGLVDHLPSDPTVFGDGYLDIEAHLPDANARYLGAVRDTQITIRDARELRRRRSKRSATRTQPSEGHQPAGPSPENSDPPTGRKPGDRPRAKRRDRQTQVVGGAQILSISPLSAKQSRDYERAGLSANEVRPKRPTFRSTVLRGERPGASLSMRLHCQQGMVQDRARANQALPIQRGMPRKDEIDALLADLGRWMEQSIKQAPTDNIAKTEAVAMLGLILATGASAEELHTLVVASTESEVPDDHSRAILTSGGLHLWVRVPAPEMDPDLYGQVSDLLQPIQTGLRLPLPHPIVEMLKTVRRNAGTNGKPTMFASDLDALKNAASAHLRKVNQRHRSQLRLPRLPSVLPQVISDQCGNWSYAWILSGDGDPHAHTQLVYQTTPETRLVAAYREAVAHIFGVPHDSEMESPFVAAGERYFGSSLHPLEGVWDGIARELRQAIPKSPSSLGGALEHAEHHNAYTLYTVMMTLAGTGLRAVRDPIESVLDIDWENGLLYVVDKEARASGNERILPLAATVLDQLQAYRRHLLAFAFRWDHRQPHVAPMLRAAAWGSDASTPFLLFLDEDMQRLPVRPKTLSPRLENLFPAPVNIGRHHIRSHLTEAGCPGEWIDALLGHEPIGMEAYGPYSALSINDLRRMTAKWIEPILQQHGWSVAEGLPE